jgi:SprT protein
MRSRRLFKQIEFLFPPQLVVAPPAFVGQPLRLPPGAGRAFNKKASGALVLQSRARELLKAHGAVRIANAVRVEWNPRLKTCAGRADYRRSLITLNPLLIHHPAEIERTLRHELAHFLAQFRVKGRRRISPHGKEWRAACRDLGIENEARCHNLPFARRTYAARFGYRCPNCRQHFPRVRRIRRAVACLACCKKYNGGGFDPRFRLRRVT